MSFIFKRSVKKAVPLKKKKYPSWCKHTVGRLQNLADLKSARPCNGMGSSDGGSPAKAPLGTLRGCHPSLGDTVQSPGPGHCCVWLLAWHHLSHECEVPCASVCPFPPFYEWSKFFSTWICASPQWMRMGLGKSKSHSLRKRKGAEIQDLPRARIHFPAHVSEVSLC